MIETIVDAEKSLERLAELQELVKACEDKRDALKAHYEDKIARAEHICELETAEARQEIAILTESLRTFAASQLTGKSRSFMLPTATLSFRKQQPKFFFGDMTEVNARDPRLLNFAKAKTPDLLKTKTEEYVDWAVLRRKLVITDGVVFFADTGETVEDLRGQIVPDKFDIKVNQGGQKDDPQHQTACH